MLHEVYNGKFKRMLACPIFAAVYGWKEWLQPFFDPELSWSELS